MILDSSNDGTSISHRVFRRFLADLIADVPVQLDKFRKEVVEPALNRGTQIEGVKTHLKDFLKAREEGNDAESRRISDVLVQDEKLVNEIKYPFLSDYWYRKGKLIAAPLFLAIIQQYAMPPRLRTVVEGAARFWSKSRMSIRLKSRPYTEAASLEYCEAYLKLCAELRKQLEAGQMIVSNGQLHSSPDATTKLKAGSFMLVNTGGFSDDLMKGVAETVEKAEHAMRSVGLGKVCYGDILVTKTIRAKSTVVAFYVFANDEMFVRANIRPHWDTVQTVCHELAHRLEHQFLKGKAREINDLYRKLARESRFEGLDPKLFPKNTETVELGDQTLEVYAVDTFSQKVKLKDIQDPKKLYLMPLKAWFQAKGIDLSGIDVPGFVTSYAGTSPGENFAEMVSYFALGRLPKNQVPLIKEIL